MLPGGLDPLYRNILAGPHKQVCRIEVWAGGERIDPYGNDGVPFQRGSVSATLTNRVARVCSLALARNLFPATPQGLLAPFGKSIWKIYSGVSGGGGPDYISAGAFHGRINDVSLQNGGGGMSLTAVDLGADVQDDYFGHPAQSVTSQTLGENFRTIVGDAIPSAVFGSFDSNAGYSTPPLT